MPSACPGSNWRGPPRPHPPPAAALLVYAMVITLGEGDGVEAVQLYIEGEPAPAVGGLPLDRALIPDLSLAEGSY